MKFTTLTKHPQCQSFDDSCLPLIIQTSPCVSQCLAVDVQTVRCVGNSCFKAQLVSYYSRHHHVQFCQPALFFVFQFLPLMLFGLFHFVHQTSSGFISLSALFFCCCRFWTKALRRATSTGDAAAHEVKRMVGISGAHPHMLCTLKLCIF